MIQTIREFTLAENLGVDVILPAGGRARGWVLVVPGDDHPGDDHPEPGPTRAPAFARMLAEGGLGVLLPEHRADPATLVSLAREMATRWGAPSMMIGLATGAAAALEVSQRLASVRAVVTVGAVRSGTDQLLASAVAPQEALLDAADHFFLREGDLEGAALLLLTWANRHLPADPGQVQTTAWTGATGYRTAVAVRNHHIYADEPIDLGGTDLGPTPFELVWAGLAACTTITLRMYADRKGWPLEEIGVEIEPFREGREVRARRILTLAGDLDEEQRARLAEIADRCPVHRSMEHGIPVTTHLAESHQKL